MIKDEGLEEGKQEGSQQKTQEIALNLIAEGMAIEANTYGGLAPTLALLV
ncbi:hypothetical protein [Anabaena azotica]|uniref:Uncharacterized protein n=1 Tax=Anabaena azotica FACHB-119 TaxID=947527 RepID=A0ABR8D9B1_9NOST|nr:hypothetical protein [Anabaena azotica]MBD2503008.1 hypothetical protein [Anabaena azotica FACHB-119]